MTETISNINQRIIKSNDQLECIKYFEQLRWKGEPYCSKCNTKHVTRIKFTKRFQCNNINCRVQFNVLTDTPLQGSHLNPTLLLNAITILANDNKISSIKFAKHLGITQKSAYYLKRKVLATII